MNQKARPSTGPVPAAQYIRMSTEHQRYSADNQAAAIDAYAAARGFEVAQTYADLGKSGLTVRGRPGLEQLLADVASGRAAYRAVLVFDVSRWGRFQDPDEAALCETMCKRAGVDVHYCAEAFENDGSPASTILKSLRRVMAAEYSRDLSTKIHAAHRRVASLGFVPNWWRPLGLRRLAVDHLGQPVRVLGDREPSLRGCRVRMVLGPPEEVALVRRIFRLVAVHGWWRTRVAAALNRQGIKTPAGRPWSPLSVTNVLRCEAYIGNFVYGRTTKRLTDAQRPVPPEGWVRAKGVFEPIVSRALFEKAQRRLAEARPRTDAELLYDLRRLLATHGRLSARILRVDPDASNCATYVHHFGSLAEAYRRIGYNPVSARQLAALAHETGLRRETLLAHVRQLFEAMGHLVRADACRGALAINDQFKIDVRCRRWIPSKQLWAYTLRNVDPSELTLCQRFDKALKPFDYCLLSAQAFRGRSLTLPEQPKPRIGLETFRSLDGLYNRCLRLLRTPGAGTREVDDAPAGAATRRPAETLAKLDGGDNG